MACLNIRTKIIGTYTNLHAIKLVHNFWNHIRYSMSTVFLHISAHLTTSIWLNNAVLCAAKRRKYENNKKAIIFYTNLSAFSQNKMFSYHFYQLDIHTSFRCCRCRRLLKSMQIKQNSLMTTLNFTIMIIKKNERCKRSHENQNRKKRKCAPRPMRYQLHIFVFVLIVFPLLSYRFHDLNITTLYWLMNTYLMSPSSRRIRLLSLYCCRCRFFCVWIN